MMPQFSKMPRQVRTRVNYFKEAANDENNAQVTVIALFSSMLISNLVGQLVMAQSRQLPGDQIGPGPNLG